MYITGSLRQWRSEYELIGGTCHDLRRVSSPRLV